jgi:hypothetical protein
MLMMAMVPAVVFWIDVKEFDWLLKIPMTMLLVAFCDEVVACHETTRVAPELTWRDFTSRRGLASVSEAQFAI